MNDNQAQGTRRVEDHRPFITAYKSVGGWKAVLMHWNTDPELGGFWEPWNTGVGAYRTRVEADREARQWAESEEVRYVPSTAEGAI